MAKHEVEIPVVGMNYRVTPSTMNKLKVALPVRARLVREPTNKHDENAIRVEIMDKPFAHDKSGFHAGYVMRQVAFEYAPLLDADDFPWRRDGILVSVDDGSGSAVLVVTKEGI